MHGCGRNLYSVTFRDTRLVNIIRPHNSDPQCFQSNRPAAVARLPSKLAASFEAIEVSAESRVTGLIYPPGFPRSRRHDQSLTGSDT